MKIIDLAEKQRNNEILPKHIRYENEDLYFDGVTYYDKEGNNDLFDILAINNNALTHLYDKVEVIEEDKKIEKLDTWFGIKPVNGDSPTTFKENTKYIDHNTKMFFEKINEIIDKVNKIGE